MSGLLQTLSSAPAGQALFLRDGQPITAGQIRATASGIAAQISSDRVYLYTASVALLLPTSQIFVIVGTRSAP